MYMNLPPAGQTSIRQEGLAVYLKREADKHNGYDYTDLEKMLNANVTKSNIARAFNVTSQTFWKWMKIYKEEKLVGNRG